MIRALTAGCLLGVVAVAGCRAAPTETPPVRDAAASGTFDAGTQADVDSPAVAPATSPVDMGAVSTPPADVAGSTADALPPRPTDVADVAPAGQVPDVAPVADAAPIADASVDASVTVPAAGCAMHEPPMLEGAFGVGTMSAIVNGVPRQFRDVQVLRLRHGSFQFMANPLPGMDASFVFGVKNTAVGSFPCSKDPAGEFGTMQFGNTGNFWSNGACTLTFTSVAVNLCERWEGSFSGTLIEEKNLQPDLVITEGHFSLMRIRF
jgi:hypothetical protein